MTNPTPQPPASDMTLRDWFAGKALDGLLSKSLNADQRGATHPDWATTERVPFTEAGRLSYKYADAMMEARKV